MSVSKANRTSADLSTEQLVALRQILPEAFAEDKIDWDLLRKALGEHVETGIERFGLTWPGKTAAIGSVLTPSVLTLRPEKDESVDFDKTENLFIEGDNLEVLKLLQKTYFGKVKMIYIDPPYNTGGDFVYHDDFAAPLDNYLKQTGQKDGNGHGLATNKETSGRYHSDWLSMMYPRLKLAWNLLRNDGVIFASIDDNEAHHLRQLMDEIFGEENFVGEFVVIRAEGGGLAKQYVKGHDYLLVYAKSIGNFPPLRKEKDIRGQIVEKDGKSYWVEEDWLRREFGKYGTLPYEEIEAVKGSEKKAEIDRGIASGEYTLIEKKNGIRIVGRLRLIEEDGSKFYSILKHLSAEGNEDLETLKLGGFFDFPKPISLLKALVLGATFSTKGNNDIILDFFAGSSTTAHATMVQNAEDGGNRKWISVQLPEPTPEDSAARKVGYMTIAEISKERIRRAALKVATEDEKKQPLDYGFKVFKLDRSNYIENNFEYDPAKSETENAQAFSEYLARASQQGLFAEVRELDVVYENIVKEGLSLNAKVNEERIADNKTYRVQDGDRELIICLDREIASTTVAALTTPTYKGKVFICLDTALNDSAKANLGLSLDLKTI